MKKIILMILSDIALVITAIVLYSPGVLALRPTDESILRAGSSIFMVIILLLGFYVINKNLITQKAFIYDQQTARFHEIEQQDNLVIKKLTKQLERCQMKDILTTGYLSIQYLKSIFILLATENDKAKIANVHEKLDFYVDALSKLLDVLYKLEISYVHSESFANVYNDNLKALKTIQQVFLDILDTIAGNGDLDDIVCERANLDGYIPDDILTKYGGE